MLKVVILDSGWGGESFANFLESELPILDIIRVIDWRHAPYEERSLLEVRDCVEKILNPYINHVDLIILAGQISTISALDYLKTKFPLQKFLGFNLSLEQPIIEDRCKKLIYLSTEWVIKSEPYQKLKNQYRDLVFIEPDCRGWEYAIDEDTLDEKTIYKTLDEIIYNNTGIPIMLGCTHFVEIAEKIKKRYSWRTSIYHDFDRILKEVYRQLDLR